MQNHERREKTVWLSVTDVMGFLLARKDAEWFRLPTLKFIPDDAMLRVVGIHVQELPQRFAIVIEHPSFPVVPEGTYPPEAGQIEIEAVQVRRVSAEPGVADYHVIEFAENS